MQASARSSGQWAESLSSPCADGRLRSACISPRERAATPDTSSVNGRSTKPTGVERSAPASSRPLRSRVSTLIGAHGCASGPCKASRPASTPSRRLSAVMRRRRAMSVEQTSTPPTLALRPSDPHRPSRGESH